MTNKFIFSSKDAFNNAYELYFTKYNRAWFAVASGSIIRGEGTYFSDLDLVVIYPKLKKAYRESFIYKDMQVEAFVHDCETIQAFMEEDYKDAHLSIIDMIVSGKPVPQESPRFLQLKKYASKYLKKGAQNLKNDQLDTMRYSVSDLIDDLKGERKPEEIRAILYKLYYSLGELILRYNNMFSSQGKHLPRILQENFPDYFKNFEEIMFAAHNNQFSEKHLEKLEEALENNGGYLFNGYSKNAPHDKRKKPLWLQ
ncbi:MAG: nucleotidyltransferase domain-containing protein [Alphaproteobacteria bacterium]